MKTRKRLDLALSLLAVVIGILFFSGNAFALPAPMLGSPVNGKKFIRGKDDFFLEVINTDGSKYIEIWVDNNSGFGSPEIGFNNGESKEYTGNDGIYLTGTYFVFSKALQNKVLENVYFWKARLLNASKNPISVWSLVKNFTLKDELAACIINSISPTSKSFTCGAGSGSVSVDVNLDTCSRSAASNNSWISITSGASGTGDGTVNYSVSENTGTSSRTGTITIGITGSTVTQTFTITQDGKSDPLPPSYTWKTSSWSGCDAGCGSGNKTRNVWCQRNDGQTVSDSYCSASGTKPNASDSCFQSCNPTAKITLLSPNPAKKGEYVFFSGEGSDPDGGNVTYKWMSSLSGELSSEAFFTNYSLKVGEHIITLQVTDDESSTASAQKTLTVTEAINLIPTVRITSHDNGHKVTSIKVKISGIASDDDGSISKAQVKVNDGDWTDAQGTTSWSKDISLKEGANTVSCRAFDDKNAESPTYSITLNCEIPQGDKAIELKDEEIASTSIGKGGEQLYFIDVPDTATVIVIKTEGTSGKVVNLYLNRDAIPTADDCYLKSTRSDGEEKFRIDASGSDTASGQTEDTFKVFKGRYYVLVKPDSNGGNYSIRARYLELRFPFVGDYKITQGYAGEEECERVVKPTHCIISDKYGLIIK